MSARSLSLALALALCTPAVFAQDIAPTAISHIYDPTHTLTPDDARALEDAIRETERAASVHLHVELIHSLEGVPIAQFATQRMRALGLSTMQTPRGNGRGVVLLVAIQDHANYVLVGDALASVLRESTRRRILDEVFRPEARAGRISSAVRRTVQAIQREILSPTPSPSPAPKERSNSWIWIALGTGAGSWISFSWIRRARARRAVRLRAIQDSLAAFRARFADYLALAETAPWLATSDSNALSADNYRTGPTEPWRDSWVTQTRARLDHELQSMTNPDALETALAPLRTELERRFQPYGVYSERLRALQTQLDASASAVEEWPNARKQLLEDADALQELESNFKRKPFDAAMEAAERTTDALAEQVREVRDALKGAGSDALQSLRKQLMHAVRARETAMKLPLQTSKRRELHRQLQSKLDELRKHPPDAFDNTHVNPAVRDVYREHRRAALALPKSRTSIPIESMLATATVAIHALENLRAPAWSSSDASGSSYSTSSDCSSYSSDCTSTSSDCSSYSSDCSSDCSGSAGSW